MCILSLVIPVYNGKNKLEQLLTSILSQLTDEVECLFVDDGSQDGSYDILCERTVAYPMVRVITQQNQGVAAARNNGMKLTTGKYIWFIDGDDWLEKDALAIVLLRIAQTHAPIYHFNFIDHFLNGTEQENQYFLNQENVYSGSHFYIESVRNFSYEMKNMVWSFVFERNFLEMNQLKFEERLPVFEDIVFLTELYQHNPTIEVIDEVLYHYKQHLNSLTHTDEYLQVTNYEIVAQTLLDIPVDSEQMILTRNKYVLLLVSNGVSNFQSELLKRMLQLNNKILYVRMPFLYGCTWKIKKMINRLARKIANVRMLWK